MVFERDLMNVEGIYSSKSNSLKSISKFDKKNNMAVTVIQTDSKTNKLLIEFAKKMGLSAKSFSDEDYEDFLFGKILKTEKTGKNVSRETIMKKLNSK